MASYQTYRRTTLGITLQDSLDELIQTQKITKELANHIHLQFDKSINTALANQVVNRVNFKGSLKAYRFVEEVKRFMCSFRGTTRT